MSFITISSVTIGTTKDLMFIMQTLGTPFHDFMTKKPKGDTAPSMTTKQSTQTNNHTQKKNERNKESKQTSINKSKDSYHHE